MLEGCARVFLIIVNIIFTLVGLGLLAGGVILRFFPNVYEPLLDELEKLIPDFSSDLGIPDVTTPDSVEKLLDLGSIFRSVGIGLLVFGIFVAAIGIVGMVGSCCKLRVLLIVYVIAVLVLFLAKLAVLIVLVTGHFHDQLKTESETIIKKDFKGITDFSIKSLSINYIMLNFECCGVNDYQDFNESENWERTQDFQINYSGYEANITATMIAPAACCKNNGTFPSSIIPYDSNCTFVPTDLNSNWKTGCWDKLNAEYESQETTIIGIYAGVLAFELFCAICGIVILCKSKPTPEVV